MSDTDPTPTVQWCETARYPKAFWLLDARLAWPLVGWLLHMTVWTFGIALVACALSALLTHIAMPPAMAMRRLTAALRGGPCLPRRPKRLFAR
ncbi:MAG: IcmT/TraK family protein [Candidatus Competibacter sp.]|nr:IcmT/TraK family protein [Candidatus Competibacter sp.]